MSHDSYWNDFLNIWLWRLSESWTISFLLLILKLLGLPMIRQKGTPERVSACLPFNSWLVKRRPTAIKRALNFGSRSFLRRRSCIWRNPSFHFSTAWGRSRKVGTDARRLAWPREWQTLLQLLTNFCTLFRRSLSILQSLKSNRPFFGHFTNGGFSCGYVETSRISRLQSGRLRSSTVAFRRSVCEKQQGTIL